MPFWLKNVGATFQRFTNKTFLVRSEKEENHLQDTFTNLSKVVVKLKAIKGAFGVSEGKFLGYMITREGIKPTRKRWNPSSI